jgi:hypothetical protein
VPLPDGSAPAELTRWRWLGFGGALLLAVGAAGAGVLPRPDDLGDLPVIRTLRTDAGVTVSIVLAVLGMAALVGAWWALRRADSLTPRWVITTTAFWSLPLLVAPPLFSRDVYSYAAQGDLLAHGLNPYDGGPAALPSQWLESISPTWYDTAAPYGPLFLQLARFAVWLCGGQLPVAVLLLRLVALIGVALIAGYLPRLAKACGVPAGSALWLGLASPLLLAHFVSGAHNDALMVGLLVAGLAYAAERRGYPAAVLLALAVAVKAPAAVALPFAVLLWSAHWPGRSGVAQAAIRTAVVAAGTFGAVTVLTGLGFGWVGAALNTPGASVQWTSVPTGWGIAAGWVASGLGQPGAVDGCIAAARAAGTLLMLAVLVGLGVAAWRRAADVRYVVSCAGWALLAVVVLAPAFHPWYLLWATVPLAASTVDRRVRTGLAAVSAALCFLVLPDGFNLARVTAVPGTLLDLAVTVALVVFLVRRLRTQPARPPLVGTTR